MRQGMLLYVVLATAVTLLMGAVTILGWTRWARLPPGGRWIVLGVAVHFVTALISAPAVGLGIRTRLFHEVPQLIGTVLTLMGFLRWQPERWQRRLLGVALVVLVVGWCVAQYLQGFHRLFSAIASPLHATFICGAAGFTLVNRVRVTSERLTAQLWYWFAIGLMIDYGTEVLLMPVIENLYGVRDDLVRLASYVHLVGGVVGYGLMVWGIRKLKGAPAPAAAPLTGTSVPL